MKRRPTPPIAALVLALLVVTAGCSSLGGGSATTATGTTDAATVTNSPEGPPSGSETNATGVDSTPDRTATDQVRDDAAVRAKLVGLTVTGLDLSPEAENRRAAIASTLGVDTRDIRLRIADGASDTVEVYDATVSRSAVVDALARQNVTVSVERVRRGVTDETQAAAVRTLRARLDVLGIDATVEPAPVEGRRGVVVTGADANASRVRDAIEDRGRVEIVAHFPANGTDGYRQVTLLTNEDFASVGSVRVPRGQPGVPVTIAPDAAANFSTALVDFGFTGEGVADCPTETALERPDTASGYCLYTVHDGEAVYAAQLSRALAADIESGEWASDPALVMTTTNASAARELRAHLQAGALPTRLVPTN